MVLVVVLMDLTVALMKVDRCLVVVDCDGLGGRY